MTLIFSPDGRKLVSTSTDSTALVWDIVPMRAKLPREEMLALVSRTHSRLEIAASPVAESLSVSFSENDEPSGTKDQDKESPS